ncbi:hypothetical protein HIM_08345 [Hirsutella minnesotensis 3608]|uniref:CCHC-type domain-containing protein n=2 Tax=Hirsutella minnesotensis 3608 TaxID=1043627 RepID=A0A0F8A3R8_9HYPO|nr:hypothetical protein HIM_08345 [Hirsutella minnesotensis 3608]
MDPTLADGSSPERTSQLVMQMMSQMAEQMQALRAEREADRDATREQIRILQDSLTTSRPTPLETEPESRPEPLYELDQLLTTPMRKTRPTLPDPPRFEGARPKFRAWLSEMKNKLRVDGKVIGSESDRFAYIYARLGGAPQQMTIAYVEAGGRGGNSDPEQYLQYLEECYGDPNAKARALDKLRSLRQKDNESFAALIPRFERELADSGGATWPEEVKISYLEGALSQELRLATVYAAPNRTTYAEWVQSLQRLSSGLESVGKRDATRSSGGTRDNRSRDSDGDTNMADVNRAGQRPKDHRKADATPKKERRCFRCGRTGHVIADCPAKVVFPDEVKKNRPATARVKQPETSDDSDSAATSSEDDEPMGKD